MADSWENKHWLSPAELTSIEAKMNHLPHNREPLLFYNPAEWWEETADIYHSLENEQHNSWPASAHGFRNKIKEEERRGNKKNKMAIKVLEGQYRLVLESDDLHGDEVFRGEQKHCAETVPATRGSEDDKECGIIYGRGHFNPLGKLREN